MTRPPWQHTTAASATLISILILVCAAFVPCNCSAGEPLDPAHAGKMAKGLDVFKAGVRQILNDSCLKCHGGEKIKGDFDLATREGLLHGGKSGKVVVLGDAKSSLLYKQIARLEEPYMPHKEKALSQEAVARIAEWIDLGAPYDKPLAEKNTKAKLPMTVSDNDRQFWSFKPLARAEPPAVSTVSPATAGGTPAAPGAIDRFILAKLREKSLSLSAPIEPRKLIRRVYFDLLGLPPKPEEVEAFAADPSPEAYSKLLDRLLESPHYGERWARHWLDVARFAESHGFEQDYDRPFAYHYRDFLIKAFNQDLPYNTFVKWQLAGDEIEPASPLAMMATGFIGAGVFPTQITANEVERTRYDALDDMAATTGTALLGLTVGCARCHDHKFDPIPTRDYYRLAAVFTTAVRSEIEIDLDPAAYKEAKVKFDREHAPFAAALAAFEKEKLPARFEEWLKTRPKDEDSKPAWIVLDFVETKSTGGATFTRQDDGSVLVTGKNADFDTYTFVAHTNATGINAVRLEALADTSMKKGGPGRAENGNFALTDFKLTVWQRDKPPDPKNPKLGSVDIPLTAVKTTFEQKGLPAKATVDKDTKSAWAVDPQFGKDHAVVFDTPQPIGFAGSVLQFTLKFENNKGHNIGRPRISISTASKPIGLEGVNKPQAIVEILKALEAPAGGARSSLTEKQKAELLKWYRTLDPEWQKQNQAAREHLKNEPKPTLAKVMVCSEGLKPIRHHTQGADFFNETHFLNRGDTNQKQGVAAPGFLQVLMTPPSNETNWAVEPPKGWRTSYRRTALANWITDTEKGAGNLLARVIVNRLWQHHMGKGIVATPSDFGFQGERPTHPELLDWLAAELMRNGWKLKPLHKLMMSSAVYMQGAEPAVGPASVPAASASPTGRDAGPASDPGNTLFWRQEPRRLEAEAIRDAMLSVSGALDAKMYGPGSLDEGMKRRSVYFTIKRSKLIPLFQLFDVPEPNSSVGARSSTTIAPQALMFLNSPHARACAKSLAQRLGAAGKEPTGIPAAVAQGYRAALCRRPSPAESEDSVAFIKQQMELYAAEKKPNAEELALTDFCQVLMSLNEFIYVE